MPDSVSLSSQYKRQFGWRDWASILKELPPLHGQTVLDLGCGVGDLAAELVARGARVIGCDVASAADVVVLRRNSHPFCKCGEQGLFSLIRHDRESA